MTNAPETENIAARWLLRREEADWSDAEQAELDAWVGASPENRIAYWRLEYGWEKVGRIAALRRPEHPQPGIASKFRIWSWTNLAASLAACFFAGAVVIMSANVLGTAYHTDVGGHQAVALVDGTKVELNTQTRLRTGVTPDVREVWLDHGEAYFEVAHDPKRPFVVHAGKRSVTVLGTKFSVRREGDRVEVAVIEGRVRVDDIAPIKPAKPRVILRGDIVIAEGASTLVAANSVDRVDAALSWRQGRLVFDQVTLADAAREFNRYNHKKLIVTDEEAADIRIGGSFDADNVEAFVRLLRKGFGLKIEDNGENVKISG